MLNTSTEFWRVEDEVPLQLEKFGIERVRFVDFYRLKFIDESTEEQFMLHCFMSGRPVSFTGGTMNIPFLPPSFNLNLFRNVGLMAAPSVARSFKELVGEDIQLFPVAYEDDPERFTYINMVKMFDCVDFERSGTEYNSKGRPSALTKDLVLRKAMIDPEVQIFTMTFLTGTVIVRDSLRRELLNRHEIRGSKFIPLSYS